MISIELAKLVRLLAARPPQFIVVQPGQPMQQANGWFDERGRDSATRTDDSFKKKVETRRLGMSLDALLDEHTAVMAEQATKRQEVSWQKGRQPPKRRGTTSSSPRCRFSTGRRGWRRPRRGGRRGGVVAFASGAGPRTSAEQADKEQEAMVR